MKRHCLILFLLIILLGACSTTATTKRVVLVPNQDQNKLPGQNDIIEPWEIIESQGGLGEEGIPEWVNRYLTSGNKGIESLAEYSGKYVFVGENRGDRFDVLQQWTNNFNAVQDLPRLVAQRMEQRLVVNTALYPDDEYGEYFETLIKKVSDGEYPGATKEQTFWLKRVVKIINEEDASDDYPQLDLFYEVYESFILITIDKETLQKQIVEIMNIIKTSPTKDQAAAINKIKRNLFEGF